MTDHLPHLEDLLTSEALAQVRDEMDQVADAKQAAARAMCRLQQRIDDLEARIRIAQLILGDPKATQRGHAGAVIHNARVVLGCSRDQPVTAADLRAVMRAMGIEARYAAISAQTTGDK